jgi:hypothetical protein
VGHIPLQHGLQVSLVDDQEPVGDLASDGAHEPLGITVRPRAARRNLDDLNAGRAEDCVERRGELAGPVTNQKPEVISPLAQVHEQIARLLSGPRPVRMRRRTNDVDVPGSDLEHEEHVIRLSVTAQSTVKKSHASVVDAWARKNRRHDVSVSRPGPGRVAPEGA